MAERIVVIGANGMLGCSLLRYLSKNSKAEVFGTVRSEQARRALRDQASNNISVGTDITSPESVENLFDEVRPTIVLNCIGVIKQLEQSNAPIPTIKLNSLLPHRLAQICNQVGARLIHFSTDCVFSGLRGMYVEDDVPDAFDLYGRSKLLGEVDYGNHLTLRTSIIGHELSSSVSLVDWYLSQSDSVKGFSKAIFSGLPTVFVAEFLHNYVLNDPELSGLYHLSVDPIDKYSLLKLVKERYAVASDIKEYTGFSIDRSLNSDKLRDRTGFLPPKWPELINKMHGEYIEYFA